MTIGMIIWLFILSIFTNIVSAITVYTCDKSWNMQNTLAKMLESRVFRYLLKFDWKSTQIYLKTFIANILLLSGALTETILFVLSFVTIEKTIKIFLSSGVLIISLLIGLIISVICRFKNKWNIFSVSP